MRKKANTHNVSEESAKLQDFMVLLARESGEIILRYFSDPALAVETKSDASPVTLADREAEAAMRRLIAKHFPAHGICGEEFGNERPEAEWVWVLDPIDGTKSFIAGTPQFGTLIALLHNGQPVLGAIHQPATGQLLTGDNRSAQMNGRPVGVRPCHRLEDAVLLTTDLRAPARHQNPNGWRALTECVAKLYTWGDCHAYFLLATGGADIACDPIMNPWDLLALIPVVRGAGGTITDWQGGDAVQGRSIVASSPSIHAATIACLNPAAVE